MTVVTVLPEGQGQPLSSAEARQLLDDIKIDLGAVDQAIETASHNWRKALPKIERALRGRAWENAGYASWAACCEAEFGHFRFLAQTNRSEVVEALRGVGMSLRAIAAATGVTHTTVRRELAGGTFVPPAPAPAFVGAPAEVELDDNDLPEADDWFPTAAPAVELVTLGNVPAVTEPEPEPLDDANLAEHTIRTALGAAGGES